MSDMERRGNADKVRLFTGIALTPEVREYVSGVSGSLSGEIDGVSWVPAENLHVTLKFFGWCRREIVPGLADAISEAAVYLPIELSIGGTCGFPSQGSARVIWVGARDTGGSIQAVHRVIDRGAARLGIAGEKRSYSPHVTIGRAKKKPVRLPERLAGEAGVRLLLQVEELVLYRSELKSTGAEYSVVERISAL